MIDSERFSQEETLPVLQNGPEENLNPAALSALKESMLMNMEKTLGVVGYAARNAGISRGLHYKWMRTDPVYKSRVESLNELLLDYAESRLLTYVQKEDLRAITFLLQTKGKQRGYTKYWIKEEDKKMFEFVLKLYNEKDADFIELMRLKYSNATESEVADSLRTRVHGNTGDTTGGAEPVQKVTGCAEAPTQI